MTSTSPLDAARGALQAEGMPPSFAELLAPLTPEDFFRDYHGKQPLHIKGAVEKFEDVCDWAAVSRLLGQSGLWTVNSLELALRGKKVEAADYCRPGPDRDNRPNQLADLARVRQHLRQGASLVLNDVTTLSPGISAVAETLGAALKAKVQANLYCSWHAYPGFSTHFDVHDVYAVHLAGHKTWNLYQRHFDNPISHPKFRGLGPDFHKAHHGPVSQTVRLAPGDLLYIPRGWYHDALAESEATLHIAFGATALIGLDVVSQLFEAALDEAGMRADLPLTNSALPDALSAIGQTLRRLLADEKFVARITRLQAAQSPPPVPLNLPEDAVAQYLVTAKNLHLLEKSGKWQLGNAIKAVPLPPGIEAPVRWILAQDQFTEAGLAAACPGLKADDRRQLVADLRAMKVLAAG